MTPRTPSGRAWFSTVAFLSVVALLVVAGLVFFSDRGTGLRASAVFPTAIGIYPGSEIRILGVPVGEVEEVVPQGTNVLVTFTVGAQYRVPAGALALVVAPTVVADRAIQLAPAYTGGPTLADGAVIPPERTAVPPEFDDLLIAVQKLSTSLGPQGVNRNGALSEALRVTADNVRGNGQLLNTGLENASRALGTLSSSREDLFGTVRNLQSFTTNLKENDAQVREFTRQFAEINRFLVGERQDLGEALRELSIALGEVATFVRDNRASVRRNVDQLAEVLNTVNGERLALDQILDTGPQGLSNLVDVYEADSGTLTTRNAVLESLLCNLLFQPGLAEQVRPLLPPTLGIERCTQIGKQVPIGLTTQPGQARVPLPGGQDGPPVPLLLRPPASPPPTKEPPLGGLLGGGR